MSMQHLPLALMLLTSLSACRSELLFEPYASSEPPPELPAPVMCESAGWAEHEGVAVIHRGDGLSLLRSSGAIKELDVHGSAPPGSTGHLSVLTRGEIIATIFNWKRADERGSEISWLNRDGDVLRRSATSETLTLYGLDADGAFVATPNDPGQSARVYDLDGNVSELPVGFRPYANTFHGGVIQGSSVEAGGEFSEGWHDLASGMFTGIVALKPISTPTAIAGRYVYVTEGKSVPWLVIEQADGQFSIEPLWNTVDPHLLSVQVSSNDEWLAVSETGNDTIFVVNAIDGTSYDVKPQLGEYALFTSPCSGPLPSVDSWGHALIATRKPSEGGIGRVDPSNHQVKQLGLSLTEIRGLSVAERGGTYLVAGDPFGSESCSDVSWEAGSNPNALEGQSLQVVRPNIGRVMQLPTAAYDPRLSADGQCVAYRQGDEISVGDVATGYTVALAANGALLWLDP